MHGQTKETSTKKVYLQIAGGGTTQKGIVGELGVQAVLKHNWTTTLSYQNIEMDPKNLPSDYDPGYFLILPGMYPTVKMNLFSLTGGKCFQMGRETWITTEAGVSLVNGEKISFTRKTADNGGWYSNSNYSETNQKKNTVGGMLKADFNWAFLPYAGLGAGVFANFNSIQSPMGFEVKLICGWMNNKRKKSE
jgi:hypothetical protein